jgi:kynureninase
MENSIPKNLESVGVNFQIWCFKNNKYLNYILGEFW